MKDEKQWVQHISGQGEKWEVLDGRPPGLRNNFQPMGEHEWIVRAIAGSEQYVMRWFALPKSEYRLCEPPEVWRDVTEFTEVKNMVTYSELEHHGCVVRTHDGSHRLRKVQLFGPSGNGGELQWAFIVEQKVSG